MAFLYAGFLSAGARGVKLGRPVFRSAHAGVAALAAVQTGFVIYKFIIELIKTEE